MARWLIAQESDYPVGYTGYYEDSESDLSYAGARYYANNVGRFYSPDPVTFRADNLFSFNRYAYGNNNPYKYTDPTGQYIESAWDVANIAIGAVSFVDNINNGNYGSAVVDVGGIIVDGIAAALPIVPGGAGASLKASRIADKMSDAATTMQQANLKKQAQQLKKLNDNKNTVKVRTPQKEISYDLSGASHKGINTPHKQYGYPNKNPDGEIFFNKDRKKVDAMTQQDIRTVKKVLKRRKAKKK